MNIAGMKIASTPTPSHEVRGAPTTAGCYDVAVTPFPGNRESREAYERGIADVRAGRTKRFKNVSELIAELNSDE